MTNLAVIDIGTLKVKFLISSVSSDGKIVTKYSSSTLTCFGCDMDANKGYVLEENLEKTLNELKRCAELLKTHKVKNFRVVSTHAMRRAKNKDEILRRIKKVVGFDVENISQEEEAQIFFTAVLKDFANKNKEYAIVDMGGGSVQILIGKAGKKPQRVHMMQTGAAFLHENFTKDSSNPKGVTTLEDIEKMKDHILKELLPFKPKKNIPIIYGSTNIIDLMKTVKLPLDPHEDSQTHPYKTYSKYLQKFITGVLPLSYQERENLYPFQWGYMWGIDKAFLNVVTIAEYLESPFIIPSNANIAQGFIHSLAGKK